MRLTVIVCKYRPLFMGYKPKWPGNILTGKHRYVPAVTLGKKIDLWRNLRYEEEVIKYLSKPYITEAQENAYLKSVNQTRPEYWDDFTRRPIEVPLKQHYAADYFAQLERSRMWENEY